MKDGSILLVVCVVVVAGVAMWMLDIDPVHPLRPANGFALQQSAPPPPQASSQAKAKQASKPAIPRAPQMRAVIEPAPTPEVSAAGAMVTGGRAPSGAQNETFAKTYGGPVLSTTRVDRGHDIDTLVYTRDRGKEVTIISFEDGKVSSTSSQSGIRPAMETPGLRVDEQAAALLPGPTAPEPLSIALPAAAEAPKTIPTVFNQTPAAVPMAAKPSAESPVQANVGTCGEYRNGKLTVKPCAEVPLSTSEWLAKGSGAVVGESPSAGSRR